MYSCYKATRTKSPFLMDVHTTPGWSTRNYSRTIRITFISSIQKSLLFLRTWKAFQSLFCAQGFAMLFLASMCGTCFEGTSPGRPWPLAGWLRCQQTQAEPSWAGSGWHWHCVLIFLGSAKTWQPRNPVLHFPSAGGRGISCFWEFWPLFLASLGATTAASAQSHVQPSSSWTSEGNAKLWWREGEVGVKEFSRRRKQGYLSMLPLQFNLLICLKKNLQKCPLSAKIQFYWDSYKCNSPPQLKKNNYMSLLCLL